jgi:hypothetical protein
VLKALECQTDKVSVQICWRHGQEQHSACNNSLSFAICIPVYTSGALNIQVGIFVVKSAEIRPPQPLRGIRGSEPMPRFHSQLQVQNAKRRSNSST